MMLAWVGFRSRRVRPAQTRLQSSWEGLSTEAAEEKFDATQQNHQHAERHQCDASAGEAGQPRHTKADQRCATAKDDHGGTARTGRQLSVHSLLPLRVIVEGVRYSGRKHGEI